MIEKSFGLLLSALIIGVVLAVTFNVVFPHMALSRSIALLIGLVSVGISLGIMRFRNKKNSE